MRAITLAASIFGTMFMAAPVQAEDIALAKNSMRLFGGPSLDYPRIGIITWGQGLRVLGCETTGAWCEVLADGQRGWVPAGKMEWPATPKSRMGGFDHRLERVTL